MGYKDRDMQREYQKHWMRMRRAEVMNGETCKICGSAEHLEIHHRNPEEKKSHKIWSWAKERMKEELSKCDILCRRCHDNIHLGV